MIWSCELLSRCIAPVEFSGKFQWSTISAPAFMPHAPLVLPRAENLAGLLFIPSVRW